MNNLTRGQTILIGVAALFGIPICIGFAVGYLVGFWPGVLVAVLAIAIIAPIALKWRQKRQNKGRDDNNKD